MTNEAPDLAQEFPELKAKIHELKVSDRHFAKLFDVYHTINKEVHRIEAGIEAVSDQYMEELKKQRLGLKDELFEMIQG